MDAKITRVLILEPFYTGSHKQLVQYITQLLSKNNIEYYLETMNGKKWHWRARTSALHFSQIIPKSSYQILFCSSVLNLAELVALRPDLQKVRKIVYFHENQFVYPVQVERERDFQYGYNTILTAMVADEVLFNSRYNMKSFLSGIKKHLSKQPDYHNLSIREHIEPKCRVLYFPVSVQLPAPTSRLVEKPLHIIWPHRWEHDKDPETFFEVLKQLKDGGFNFKVSILGESYVDPMPIFSEMETYLKDNIENFGRLQLRVDYVSCLLDGDVVVSTAKHEFFGVAVLEATLCGCFPLVPNKLAYPEMYPHKCTYNTPNQLYKKLKQLCLEPNLAKKWLSEVCDLSRDLENPSVSDQPLFFDGSKFSEEVLSPFYLQLFK